MLKLKLQYFGHLMRRADSFEKTLMLGKIEGRRRRGWQRMRRTQWTWVWAHSGSWWWTGKPGMLHEVHEVAKSRHDWVTELTVHFESTKIGLMWRNFKEGRMQYLGTQHGSLCSPPKRAYIPNKNSNFCVADIWENISHCVSYVIYAKALVSTRLLKLFFSSNKYQLIGKEPIWTN